MKKITTIFLCILTALIMFSCKTVEHEFETNQTQHIGWWRSQLFEYYPDNPYTNHPSESIEAVVLIGDGFDAGKPWVIVNPEYKYKQRPSTRPIEVICYSKKAIEFLCNAPAVDFEARGAWHAIFCGTDGKLAGIKTISSYSFNLMPDKDKSKTQSIKDDQISPDAVRQLYNF
ncbi:MAG: hypothetical protein PF692_11270 [Kiritimatiellae bacterium]|jgi:hypothetical protein|nr:hypothetical protein [Kiritimatiellia bacterium]